MQLVKLYSNKTSFHNVEFKTNNINFIVAKQKNKDDKISGNTYNGVGKSLLIRIIHFCLGANIINYYKRFCEQLKGWEFCLEFTINNKIYTVKRSVDNPNSILFQGEEIKVKEFKEIMGKLCFSIPENVSALSFRNLLPFFIRPEQKSYIDCTNPTSIKNDYQQLLINSFLLGLDSKLVEKKYKLKKEKDDIKNIKNGFVKNEVLKDFFTGHKDIDLTITDINEQIKSIEANLQAFTIADDYNELQDDANKKKTLIDKINNEINIIQNLIANIDMSLNRKSGLSTSEVIDIYAETDTYFSENIKHDLETVQNFYKTLLKNRNRKLLEQKNELIEQKKEKTKEMQLLSNELDDILQYLGNHQALDMYTGLTNKLSKLREEKNRLEQYINLNNECTIRERELKKDMIEFSEQADTYLIEVEQSLADIKNFFRKITKEIYPKSTSGLTIRTHSGENQTAFNIEPRIESDSSDAIGHVKLFSYDLSLLFHGYNHNIDFLFHDSRLFDGIDERQKASIFKIIYNNFTNTSKQYIATINQNQINEIKPLLPEEEYDNIIEQNIILNLTDDNDSEKLLGIKVDI